MKRTFTQRTFTTTGQAIVGLTGGILTGLILCLAMRACQERTPPLVPSPVVSATATASPGTAATARPRILTLDAVAPPAYALVGTAATATASPLTLAIYRMPSSGRPSPVMAAWLAALIEAHCEDPWLVAGLIRAESGFRPNAIERGGAGPGLGLMQLHRAYLADGLDPFDPSEAIPAGCAKLERFEDYHRRNCGWPQEPHDPLVHWHAGYTVNERAIVYAATARRYAEELRRLGGEVAP